MWKQNPLCAQYSVLNENHQTMHCVWYNNNNNNSYGSNSIARCQKRSKTVIIVNHFKETETGESRHQNVHHQRDNINDTSGLSYNINDVSGLTEPTICSFICCRLILCLDSSCFMSESVCWSLTTSLLKATHGSCSPPSSSFPDLGVKGKGKGSFYIAQYPVRWTAQSASHFLPSLTDLFIPTPFSASPGSILAWQQLRAKTKSLTFPPLSIARYSFIQLSEQGRLWSERKMPNLRNGSKGGFEPGLSRLRVRHSTTELLRSTAG